MDWPRLDTSSWNLTLGAVATSMLAGCGPLVVLEGETDSDSVTDTDPRPTDPSETDTTPWIECNESSDCPSGYDCIGNVCMPYDYYCQDGGCCYGGTGGCCYYDECCYGDCYYEECYSDEQCGFPGLCITDYGYGSCVYPYAVPDCTDAPQVVPLELPQIGEGELVSLSFVDADGDAAHDVVVGRNGTTELHRGANAAPPSLLPVTPGAAVTDATSGDFDADGDVDLVVATFGGDVLMLAGDGVGGFTLAWSLPLGQPAFDLVALQWNGDGMLDLALRLENGGAHLQMNDGMGWLGSAVGIPAAAVQSIAATDFGGDDYDDLVLNDVSTAELLLGDFSGDVSVDAYLPGEAHGERRVLSGLVDASLPEEVVGSTPMGGYLLLELWANGLEGPQRFSLLGEDVVAGLGDFSGDGVADVIATGGPTISYVRGHAASGYPTFECRSTYFSGITSSTIDVGDFDGNGRADVLLDGEVPFVMLTQ